MNHFQLINWQYNEKFAREMGVCLTKQRSRAKPHVAAASSSNKIPCSLRVQLGTPCTRILNLQLQVHDTGKPLFSEVGGNVELFR